LKIHELLKENAMYVIDDTTWTAIAGGTYQSGESAGEKAGKAVKNAVETAAGWIVGFVDGLVKAM
jgi:hypothetical protein